MTPEEFRTTSFVYGMKVKYKGEEREVEYLDREEEEFFLIGVLECVHFSEVELIKE
jgi:hypothetical protein